MAAKGSIGLKRAKAWAPRQEIAPKTGRRAGAYVVTSNGGEGCYGGWDLTYPAPKAGSWVRFGVDVAWRDLARGFDSVNVAVTWLDAKGRMVGWEPVFPQKITADRVEYGGRVRVSADAKVMVARLLMAWSSTGEVRFAEPMLTRADAPKARRRRLGAAGGPVPPGKRTLANNTEFYLGLCEQAAAAKVDLLCLPEIMLATGRRVDAESMASLAHPVPGPETEPFQNLARHRRMSLCYSVLERNGEMVHNTAILIDKRGKLVGKYRKVHLAQPTEVWWGVTPGHDFPVCNVDGVKVGMNICMDSSAAESARVPARCGAEVVCMPIMGDHRASSCIRGAYPHEFDIDRWQAIQRVRAMDNQVFMLISRNQGIGSGVFAPTGEVLALSCGGRLVHADVDFEDLPRTGHDSTFRGVAWYERREPTYGPLAGGLLPDPFAS